MSHDTVTGAVIYLFPAKVRTCVPICIHSEKGIVQLILYTVYNITDGYTLYY